MRRFLGATLFAFALVLSSSGPALAVYNGSEDGNGHPVVGFVLGTRGPDPCDYEAQAIGCSGVLIDSDVFLSTADCTDSVKGSIDTGFIDDGWVILDANPLVPGAPRPFWTARNSFTSTGSTSTRYGSPASGRREMSA